MTPDQTMTTAVVNGRSRPGAGMEARIGVIGDELARTLSAVVDAVPGGPLGPVDLARTLGVDKVLTSRLLKALRNKDPLAVVHLLPGPEPIRRAVRAAGRRGVDAKHVRAAEDAVTDFESLIRQDAGDRSALDAIIAAWLPEARDEFELRRKQAAFKAMSQLKGVTADVSLGTVVLAPSDDGCHLDVVWITGLLGLRRLRPRAGVKFASRRLAGGEAPRRPVSLEGKPVDDLRGVRLDDFCSSPPPRLEVKRAGEVVHYVLGDHGFGPRSAVDLVYAEVNRAELPRFVPAGSGRKAYFFAEVGTPCRTLHFDVLLHRDVYPGATPTLAIYDTALDGVANPNDPARDIDRLDLAETVLPLGDGTGSLRVADVPRYADLVRHVYDRMQWNAAEFRGFRCRSDHPIYGSQVTMLFDVPDGNVETSKRRSVETGS